MLLKDLPFVSHISRFILFSTSSCSSLSLLSFAVHYHLHIARSQKLLTSESLACWLRTTIRLYRILSSSASVWDTSWGMLHKFFSSSLASVAPNEEYGLLPLRDKKRGNKGFVIRITCNTYIRLPWWLSVKNPPVNAGDMSSVSGLGGYTCHKATKPKSHNSGACALQQEEPHTATGEQPLTSTTTEKLCSNKDPK